MIWKPRQLNNKTKESGNMILALFGAVALVGVLSAGTGIIINGPMKVMSQVNQSTQTESQIMVASKMIMLDVANLTGTNGDCDSDRLSEPREWRAAAGAGPDGVADSDGGGFLPMAIGASKRDSWGTQYGYCVWDHGAIIDDAGCGGGAQLRLEGLNSIDHPVIAIISAGKNKTFETPCRDFSNADNNSDGDILDAGDDPLIAKGGDDILTIYSYAEAAEDNPGLWSLTLNASGEAVAVMDGSIANVEFTGSSTSFGGNLTLDGTEGLDIPDDATLITCDATKEGQIRRNMTSAPPVIEICEDTGGTVYAWTSLATSTPVTTSDIASEIADPVFDPNRANCTKNKGGPLELAGTFDTSGSAQGIWEQDGYIYVADGTIGGLRVYTFDGSNFTEVAFYDTPGNAFDVWVDDRGYVYVSDYTLLHAFTFDGSTLSLIDTYPSPDQFYRIWGDETYIYIADDQGVRLETLSFDGTSFQSMAGGNGGRPQDVSGNDKYVFVAGRQNGLRAIISDGQTNTALASIGLPVSVNVFKVWANNDYIFAGGGTDFAAFSFDGNAFTQLDAIILTNSAKDIWGDGEYIYITDGIDLKVFKFTGSSFIEVNSISTVGTSQQVVGDGTYIYVSDGASGIHAYSGFTCTEAYVPNIEEDYIGQITVTQTGPIGSNLGSVGWAQTLASDNNGDEAGIAFVIDRNASKSSMPTAAITAMRESDPSAAGLVFKTKASDGTINNRVYLASSGYLGVDVSPGNANYIQSYLQIGSHDAVFSDDFQKGLFVSSDTAGTDQIGYFGFYNDGTDTNTIMFSKTLKIKKSNVTGNALREYIRFESTAATTFFGSIEVKGDAQTVAIRNKSYSATDVNDGELNFKRKRLNTSGTDVIVQNDDTIGTIKFQGYDGSSLYENGPQIISKVDGTPVAGNIPTDISFKIKQTNFDPEHGNCAVNNGGPFVELGSYNTPNNAYEVWGDGTYIYVGDGTGGVFAYTFDGTTFTEVGSYDTPGTVRKLWGDGTYIYVADDTSEILALTFNGSTFTEVGSYNTPHIAWGIWGDGTYIYVADWGSGVRAYTFNGSTFTEVGSYNTPDKARNVWGDGTYIYVADSASGVYVFTFDGTTFTALDSFNTPNNAIDVWGDGAYIYVADHASIRAYTFDGTTFIEKAIFNATDAIRNVWSDGTYIYVGDGTAGVHALTFDGLTFNTVDLFNTANQARRVWGDGTYIYVADNVSGIRAYSGFECYSELKVTGTGDIAIQKTGTPEAKLHVGGRILADEGILIGTEVNTGCGTTADEGTLRYVSGDADPLEICDGTSWIKISAAVPTPDPSVDCSPIPFDLLDITDTTASTEYTSNSFIVGGLDTAEECYLTLSTDASSAKINLNGADETGTMVAVQNGDIVNIKATSGTGDECKNTYLSLGKQTDLFSVGVGSGCYRAADFNPETANCVANNGGPFVEAGSYNTPDRANDVWGDGTYIYIADRATIKVYTFDGTTFTEVGSYNTGDDSIGVWGDGTYIYITTRNFIEALTFDGTTFTQIDSAAVLDRGLELWGDGTYIYVADKGLGVTAFSFDGTTLTQVGNYNTPGNAENIWGDGTYIYVADGGSGVRAYTFNGTTFTEVGSYNTPNDALDVWGDATYIYVADSGSGVRAYTFNGTTFTEVGSYNTSGLAYGVWGDGTHTYIADESSGIHAFTFDGSTFTLVNTYNTPDRAYGVWGDGTYVYVADDGSGVRAYSGFECTEAN